MAEDRPPIEARFGLWVDIDLADGLPGPLVPLEYVTRHGRPEELTCLAQLRPFCGELRPAGWTIVEGWCARQLAAPGQEPEPWIVGPFDSREEAEQRALAKLNTPHPNLP